MSIYSIWSRSESLTIKQQTVFNSNCLGYFATLIRWKKTPTSNWKCINWFDRRRLTDILTNKYKQTQAQVVSWYCLFIVAVSFNLLFAYISCLAIRRELSLFDISSTYWYSYLVFHYAFWHIHNNNNSSSQRIDIKRKWMRSLNMLDINSWNRTVTKPSLVNHSIS